MPLLERGFYLPRLRLSPRVFPIAGEAMMGVSCAPASRVRFDGGNLLPASLGQPARTFAIAWRTERSVYRGVQP